MSAPEELRLEVACAARSGHGLDLAPHRRLWWPWVSRHAANNAVLDHEIAWRDHLTALLSGDASHCVCAGLVMAAHMNGDGVIEARCPVHHYPFQESS